MIQVIDTKLLWECIFQSCLSENGFGGRHCCQFITTFVLNTRIDTSKILFICGGAFVGLDKIIQKRKTSNTIGFTTTIASQEMISTYFNEVTTKDLVTFGMIPEFVGRFPSWVALNELSHADLIRILTEVKHCYVDQYKWLFEQDEVALDFESTALTQIAENTLKNKTGARGLHSELERVLLPHMFNLTTYKNSNIKHVLITPDLVNTPIELKGSYEQVERKVSNS